MRYTEILEACWKGYRRAGMKKKGGRQVPNCVPVSEQQMEEDLKKWFKEKWVRFGPDGKIRGACARGSEGEGKPKCLPQAKAQALGKKGRAASSAKKRREDPNPERRGAAKNVATKVKEDDMDEGWKQNMAAGILGATMALSPVPTRAEIANMPPAQLQQLIKHAELAEKYTEIMIQRAKDAGRSIDPRMMDVIKIKASEMAERQMQKQKVNEKQDACYRKVKSRYKVWPSAYASGALVQCRKKGATNWGNSKK